MAYEDKEKGAGEGTEYESTELLCLARKRLELAQSATSESRLSELDDLRFLAGSPDNKWQWPDEVVNGRTQNNGAVSSARPCLTINKLPQHVLQVTNDQKQNRPAGKVIPVNNGADQEVAEVLDGIIRHIEYISDADVAYDTACSAQVITGEGYFRILTDYLDDTSFEQDIKIGRIKNQFSVHMDPTIQDPCGADAEWCFISIDMMKEDYERDYPNAQPVSSLELQGTGDEGMKSWVGNDTIRIAEYFYAEYEPSEIYLYPGNEVAEKGSLLERENTANGVEPLRRRTVQKRVIKWCKINGYEVLEEQVWPGNWIPIIRVVGNEFEVDGEMHISGIVRNAKDAQRMYNYWASQEAEMLALAPKAPFIGYGGQFEGYENQWKTANTVPWPYLEVNPDITDGQGGPLPLPQRAAPPLAQTGLIQAKMGASEDIKSTTGQYDSSLGQQGNEKSGKAILARERQTDTGTYHYVDNLARAIRFGTRQIVDLIPKIMDTARVARIISVEGDVSQAEIDPAQQEARKDILDGQGNSIRTIYNPGIGTYDVRVTTGPSYTTKREEAADTMGALVQGNPELWSIAGDLIVTAMDWPGAQELAKRLRRTIDPKLLADEDSPELAQAQQQMEAMQGTIDQMKQMLDNAALSLDAREVAVKEADSETRRMKVELDAREAGLDTDQIQEIIMGTIAAMKDAGELSPGELQPNTPPEQPQQIPGEQI